MPKTKVGTTSELPDHGSSMLVDVDGIEIALFNIDEEYVALLNNCPHQLGPICEGELTGEFSVSDDDWTFDYLEDSVIICPWHKWRFDPRTGDHRDSDQYSIPTFDVEVAEDDVYVLH